MKIDDLDIDWHARRVKRQAQELVLGDLNFQVFRLIADAYPDVASADDLKAAWPAAHVSEETIAKRITLLRRALGDPGRAPRYIETVRGKGYRLKTPPQAVAATPQTNSGNQSRDLMDWRGLACFAGLMIIVFGLFWLNPRNTSEVAEGIPQMMVFSIPQDDGPISARLLPLGSVTDESLTATEDGTFILIVARAGLPQSAGRQLDYLARQLDRDGSDLSLAKAERLRSALQRIHYNDYIISTIATDKPAR